MRPRTTKRQERHGWAATSLPTAISNYRESRPKNKQTYIYAVDEDSIQFSQELNQFSVQEMHNSVRSAPHKTFSAAKTESAPIP